MIMELTSEECEVLQTLLDREITELIPEIRHTDTQAYRDDLKAKQRTLRRLSRRLRELQPA